MLIGFLGKMGVGKTTIANMLMEKYPDDFTKMAFADELKNIAIKYFNLSHKEVYIRKNKTSRQILQGIGAFVRNEIGQNCWIDKLSNTIFEHDSYVLRNNLKRKIILIDDVRYRNEAEWVRKKGIVIKLICPNNPLTNKYNKDAINHESEKEVDLAQYDYEVSANYGEIDYLYQQVENILKENNIL